MSQHLPVLYSFRRCPYAIRARLAIVQSGVTVELREVVLSQKPTEMLAASAKGTVPVLVLPDGQVIDESRDVMQWALAQYDPAGWLGMDVELAEALINKNDFEFKPHLDAYKYIDRYPGKDQDEERARAEEFLAELEGLLTANQYLTGPSMTLVDVAILPFIRQFAGVDASWFATAPYPQVRSWHDIFIESALFKSVMGKYPQWAAGSAPTVFGPA